MRPSGPGNKRPAAELDHAAQVRPQLSGCRTRVPNISLSALCCVQLPTIRRSGATRKSQAKPYSGKVALQAFSSQQSPAKRPALEQPLTFRILCPKHKVGSVIGKVRDCCSAWLHSTLLGWAAAVELSRPKKDVSFYLTFTSSRLERLGLSCAGWRNCLTGSERHWGSNQNRRGPTKLYREDNFNIRACKVWAYLSSLSKYLEYLAETLW